MKKISDFIQEVEEFYYVTTCGKVISTSKKGNTIRKLGLIRRTQISKSGYEKVDLQLKNKKIKTYLLHRLVAICYLVRVENKTEVNHINRVRSDNRLCNLEWSNRIDNLNHSDVFLQIAETNKKNGVYEQLSKNNKLLKSKPVDVFSADGTFLETVASMSVLKGKGFTPQGISLCCNGKLKTHKKHIFKFSKK